MKTSIEIIENSVILSEKILVIELVESRVLPAYSCIIHSEIYVAKLFVGECNERSDLFGFGYVCLEKCCRSSGQYDLGVLIDCFLG
jgi:hypothetical protein